MLRVTDFVPPGLPDREAGELHDFLGGPTLLHLPGRRTPPLFVSVLLHGDEDSGWRAMRDILRRSLERPLSRALSLFIGNTAAAAKGVRYLPEQPDYNRIWTAEGAGEGPEVHMARRVVEEMRARGTFASVDIHNNSGVNPHYGCVRVLDDPSLHLATLFSRTVVFARRPGGVQADAFASLCPTVTVECGQKGGSRGAEHAREYVEACLHLTEIPAGPVREQDLDLFHTVAVARLREGTEFGFGPGPGALRLRPDLDHLNFRELQRGTPLGETGSPPGEVLSVLDESGAEVAELFFSSRGGTLAVRKAFMPSMFTVDARAVRLDCLGYLMERLEYRPSRPS